MLMGFFAFFCGIIYNDFLSVPFPFQNTCYIKTEKGYSKIKNCDYMVGIDYTWHHASNGIGFVNSLKMKMSIIIGVLHMILGILLKGSNNLYFKDYAGFFFEFIPQLVFMISTFGYMVFCIIYKWF